MPEAPRAASSALAAPVSAPSIAGAPVGAGPARAEGGVVGRARRAVEEAERRGLPPEPRVFELFYTWLAGDDPQLATAVDQALPPGAQGDLEAVERIYERHLALGGEAERFITVGQQVELELALLGESIARQSASADAFRSDLFRARDGLSILARPGTVKNTIRELIDLTSRHATQTGAHAAELAAARAQIADLRAELAELRERAYQDHLTGLANRRRFDMALDAALAEASLPGGGALSLVLLDLDHFKRINDEFGHAVGDSVLKQVGRLLRQNTKGKDIAARFGGEEFALVLPRTERLGARHVAERIRQELAARSLVISGTRRRLGTVTASLGVAERRPGEDARSLIARADEALYAAKSRGRNLVIAAD